MSTLNRNGNKWTVNELLSLQREYELLEWTIQQIALKHQRTERAILFRLESEGIIASWNDARGFDMESYKASIEDDVTADSNDDCDEQECCDNDSEYDDDDCDEQECCDNDSEYDDDADDDDADDDDEASEVEKLSDRIWSLETTVTDIKDIVQQLFNSMISSNKTKLAPLRKRKVEQH